MENKHEEEENFIPFFFDWTLSTACSVFSACFLSCPESRIAKMFKNNYFKIRICVKETKWKQHKTRLIDTLSSDDEKNFSRKSRKMKYLWFFATWLDFLAGEFYLPHHTVFLKTTRIHLNL